MSKLLKGNFEPKKQVERDQKDATMEDKFEQAALARLGGSIGFVSRKSFVWTEDGEDTEMEATGRASQYDKD